MPPARSASRSRRDSSRSARACRISPPGIGGIATQALVNPYYGIDGVKLLREGTSPREIVETLIAGDAGRESRQLHIMDAQRPDRRPYRDATASTGAGTSRATAFPSPATCWRARACSTTPRRPIVANAKPAVRATPDRGDARGRSRRRRQARQAIGGASDLRRGGMVRLSICASTTTPIRSPSSNGSSASAASAGCISANFCRRGRIRPGSPIAPPSTPASKPRSRASNDGKRR